MYYFCRDKSILAATKDLRLFVVCDDKTFVATKIILAAAPANDGKEKQTRVTESLIETETLVC